MRRALLAAAAGASILIGCGASRLQRRDYIRVDDLAKESGRSAGEGVGGAGSEASRPSSASAASSFAATPRPAAAASPARGATAAGDAGGDQVITEAQASEGIVDVVAEPGPPILSAAKEAGGSVLADATVGEVNGRSVTVSGILEPIGPRLGALSRERGMTRDRWRGEAARAIGIALSTYIDEELLRAEALASLTPEQKMGLFAFLDNMQKDYLSKNLGSVELAGQRLAEREGRTLDDLRTEEEMKVLIRHQLQQKVWSRVQVGRRDSQIWYKNNAEKFNPPPKAKFRRIAIQPENTAAIEEVTRRLGAGEAIAGVASIEANILKGENNGLYEAIFKGERAAAELFRSPEINKAAQRLEPGQVEGPMNVNSLVQWIGLESIESKSMDWYEAQLVIEQQLQYRQAGNLRDRYMSRLKSRASFTAFEEMHQRLMTIAEERYFKPLAPAAERAKQSP